MTATNPTTLRIAQAIGKRDYTLVGVAEIAHPGMITSGLISVNMPFHIFAVEGDIPYCAIFDGEDFSFETNLNRVNPAADSDVYFFEVVSHLDYFPPPRTDTPWADVSATLARLSPVPHQ